MRSEKRSLRDIFFAQKMTKRQKVTKRLAGLAVAVCVGCAVVLALFLLPGQSQSKDVPRNSGGRAMPVKVIEAESVASYHLRRSFTGTLKAKRSSELGFERAGKITRLLVQEGQSVEQGDTLAELDRRHLQAEQSQLKAQRQQAAAVLDELIAGPRQETIAAMRAEVTDLEAQRDLQSLKHERRTTLLKRGVISREEFDESSFGTAIAAARVDVAQRKLDELLAGTRDEQVRAQRAVVDQLDAQLLNMEADFADTTLLAPFSGVVSRRMVDEGAVVSPGQSIFNLVESNQLEAWVGLPPAQARRLRSGDDVRLRIDQDETTATVTSLLPELNSSTRTRTVILDLPADSEDRFTPGQIARLNLESEVQSAGIWLPISALIRSDKGLWACFVAQQDSSGDHHAVRCEVEVVHLEGDRALVRGTLLSGQSVIAEGTHRIVDGQRVSLVSGDTVNSL